MIAVVRRSRCRLGTNGSVVAFEQRSIARRDPLLADFHQFTGTICGTFMLGVERFGVLVGTLAPQDAVARLRCGLGRLDLLRKPGLMLLALAGGLGPLVGLDELPGLLEGPAQVLEQRFVHLVTAEFAIQAVHEAIHPAGGRVRSAGIGRLRRTFDRAIWVGGFVRHLGRGTAAGLPTLAALR